MSNNPNDPYIERPDEEAVSEDSADHMFCWMQWSRECGGDCVAFEELARSDERMSYCKLLNAVRSVSMSFGLLTKALTQLVSVSDKQAKKAAAEELRKRIEEIPQPPKVTP